MAIIVFARSSIVTTKDAICGDARGGCGWFRTIPLTIEPVSKEQLMDFAQKLGITDEPKLIAYYYEGG